MGTVGASTAQRTQLLRAGRQKPVFGVNCGYSGGKSTHGAQVRRVPTACRRAYLCPMSDAPETAAAAESAADLETRIRRKLLRQHFMHLIGADLTQIRPGRVEAALVLGQQHQQQRGFAHGGLVATMADLAAGFAGVTLLPDDYGLVTADLKISYLNPGVGAKIRAVGWVLKAGRRLHFCEAEVWCDEVLIAKASATMAVLEPS